MQSCTGNNLLIMARAENIQLSAILQHFIVLGIMPRRSKLMHTHFPKDFKFANAIFPLVITCVYEYVCMHIEGCVIHIRGILAASTTVLHAVGIALASPTRHYHHLYQRQRCYLDRTASCCYCVALSAFGFVVAMAITDSYKSFIEWTPNYLSIYVSFKGSRL